MVHLSASKTWGDDRYFLPKQLPVKGYARSKRLLIIFVLFVLPCFVLYFFFHTSSLVFFVKFVSGFLR